MKRTRILGGILAGLLAAAGPAMAQSRGGSLERSPGGRGGKCTNALVAALSLTADQKTALDTLRLQTANAVHAIVVQEQTLHGQIATALAAATPDRCAIGDLEIAGYGLRQEISTIETSAEATFVASLSADQKTAYTAFLAANPGCSAIPSHPAGPPGG